MKVIIYCPNSSFGFIRRAKEYITETYDLVPMIRNSQKWNGETEKGVSMIVVQDTDHPLVQAYKELGIKALTLSSKPTPESEPEPTVNYEGMTKGELSKLTDSLGITVTSGSGKRYLTKVDYLAALQT